MFSNLVVFRSSGTLELNLGNDAQIKIVLSEQERDTIISMCESFYAQRQQKLSDLVACPLPQLADYSEAEDA